MKRFFLTSLLILGITASACWFTEDSFNTSYIAGANNYVVHYTETNSFEAATYYNGMSVSMPMTLFVKISPRESGKNIVQAVLQYKISGQTTWTPIRTLTNVSDFNQTDPVAIFGRNTIDIPGLKSGDEFYIRVYLTDGIYETGNLNKDITQTPKDTESSETSLGNGWTPAFIFRLKYNGYRRAR